MSRTHRPRHGTAWRAALGLTGLTGLIGLTGCHEARPPEAVPILTATSAVLTARAELGGGAADGPAALRAWLETVRPTLDADARAVTDRRLSAPTAFALTGAVGEETFLEHVDTFVEARSGLLLEELHTAFAAGLEVVTVSDPRRRRAQAALLVGAVWDGTLSRLQDTAATRHRLSSTRPGPGLLGATLGQGPRRVLILVPGGELAFSPDPSAPAEGLPRLLRDAAVALTALDVARTVLGASTALDQLTFEVIVDASVGGDALASWWATQATAASTDTTLPPTVLRLDLDDRLGARLQDLVSVKVADDAPLPDTKALALRSLESAPGSDDRSAAWARAELEPLAGKTLREATDAVRAVRDRFADARPDAGAALELWAERGRVVVLALGGPPPPGVPRPPTRRVPPDEDAVEVLCSFLALLTGDASPQLASAAGAVPKAARLGSSGPVPAVRFVTWAFAHPTGLRPNDLVQPGTARAEPRASWRITRVRNGGLVVHLSRPFGPDAEEPELDDDPWPARFRRLLDRYGRDNPGLARQLVAETHRLDAPAATSPEAQQAWDASLDLVERRSAEGARDEGTHAEGVELERARVLAGWMLRVSATP